MTIKFETAMATFMALDYDAAALREIAEQAKNRVTWLKNEAQREREAGRVEEAERYDHDAAIFGQLAAYTSAVAAVSVP